MAVMSASKGRSSGKGCVRFWSHCGSHDHVLPGGVIERMAALLCNNVWRDAGVMCRCGPWQ